MSDLERHQKGNLLLPDFTGVMGTAPLAFYMLLAPTARLCFPDFLPVF